MHYRKVQQEQNKINNKKINTSKYMDLMINLDC